MTHATAVICAIRVGGFFGASTWSGASASMGKEADVGDVGELECGHFYCAESSAVRRAVVVCRLSELRWCALWFKVEPAGEHRVY